MIEFGAALMFSAFIAGLLTFFAPCTFPLIPAFLGVVAGVPQDQLADPTKLRKLRWKIFGRAVFYVLGFSLIFILFGIGFSFLGQILAVRIWIERIGGILIVLFGLFLLGWLKIPWLSLERQIHIPKLFQTATKGHAFGIGALFALGWSPCIGPILGSILLLASNSATVGQGIVLLIVFSLGLAIPFLLTALLIGKAFTVFGRWERSLKVINTIAGVFLIILGVLLITNQYANILNDLRSYFTRFQFYEEFINRYL